MSSVQVLLHLSDPEAPMRANNNLSTTQKPVNETSSQIKEDQRRSSGCLRVDGLAINENEQRLLKIPRFRDSLDHRRVAEYPLW